MSSIDERIVQMKFDNGQFQKGVSDSLKSIDSLKQSLNFDSAKAGLVNLGASIQNGISLDKIGESIDSISSKFSAFTSAAGVALGNLAATAVQTGISMVKSLTVDPVMQGYQDYSRKLTSVQTITAATGKSIKDVEVYFNELDTYADKTIYNLSDMTGALAKFVNAGVSLDQAVPAIKGISNMTALAGQDANAAGIAYYNLSQSIAGGFLTRMDYKSLSQANIATKEWRTNTIKAALAAKTLKKGSNGLYNIKGTKKTFTEATLFTDGLQEQWATTKVLLNVLGDYGNENTKIGKKAQASAQDIKSLSMMMDTLRASVGTSWTDTFQIVIGNLDESKKLWTGLTSTIQGYLDKAAAVRNNLLNGWKELGGRTVLLDTLTNAFNILMSIIKPISDAFKEIFPPITAKQLYNLTLGFQKFIESLKPSSKMIDNIKSTFKGLFAVLDIVWMVVKGLFGVFVDLVGSLFKTSDSVLEVTGNVGDFLVKVRDSIKQGTVLANIFKFIGEVLKYPIDLFGKLTGAIATNQSASKGWTGVWENIIGVFKGIWEFIKPAVDWIVSGLKTTGDAIKNFFTNMNFDSFMAILNTGIFSVFAVIAAKVAFWAKNTFGALGFNLVSQIKDAIGTFTDYLSAMQQEVNSKTIMNIAKAVVILAASMLILSFIPVDKLAIALGAIVTMMTILISTMVLFDKYINIKGAVKMQLIATALTTMSIAMVIFTGAIALMSKLSWEEIARGLIGLAGGLAVMLIAAKLISKNMGSVLSASFGILVLSNSLVVLGLVMKLFGNLSWDEISKGLISITSALILIAIALRLMPNNLLLLAPAINMIAFGLSLLARAIKFMGSMSWDEVGRGLTVLAGSLIILAGALMLMQNALPGAGALIIAALALAILTPALMLMGKMSWDEIGKGLLVLAVSLAVIAGAGYLLIGALPGLIGLGIAAGLIGIGILAAATGVFIFVAALTALSAASAIGVAAISGIVLALANLIPFIAQKIAEGFIAIVNTIANSGLELIAALTTVLTALITSIKNVAPLFINTLFDIIMLLVSKLEENVPKFVVAGLNMITGILDGLAKGLPKLMTKATDVIVNFLKGIQKNLPRVIDEGIKTVIAFINGVADGINKNAKDMRAAGEKLALALVDGMTGGLGSKAKNVWDAAMQLGNNAISGIKKALGINSPSKAFMEIGKWSNEGLALGLGKYASVVSDAAKNVGSSAIDGLKNSVSRISDIVSTDINMNPTIKPVLDLTNIKNSSALIDSMLSPSTINANSSYNKASSISVDKQLSTIQDQTQQTDSTKTGDTNISFIQNNNSPKALSASEIYRQTKNQISTAKGIIAVV